MSYKLWELVHILLCSESSREYVQSVICRSLKRNVNVCLKSYHMVQIHRARSRTYEYIQTVQPYAYVRTLRVYAYSLDHTPTVHMHIWPGTYMYSLTFSMLYQYNAFLPWKHSSTGFRFSNTLVSRITKRLCILWGKVGTMILFHMHVGWYLYTRTNIKLSFKNQVSWLSIRLEYFRSQPSKSTIYFVDDSQAS